MGVHGMRTIALGLIIWWIGGGNSFAHEAGGASGDRISWTLDPWILTPLAMFGLLYAVGLMVMRGRAGRERILTATMGGLGWLTLVGSLVSPLHWLGEHLFTFHMIEHEIIMAVSAPLLVLGNPTAPLLWSLPRRFRVAVGRTMRRPIVTASWRWVSQGGHATAIHGAAIWLWHAPILFDMAVTNIAMHRFQHLSFFFSAVLFWWSVFRRSEAGAAAWHVFITMLHTGVLGALMALAPRVLYQAQTATAAEWGLTPLEDQQLAGLIMWVPAGTIYAGATVALVAIWIRQSGKQAENRGAIAI